MSKLLSNIRFKQKMAMIFTMSFFFLFIVMLLIFGYFIDFPENSEGLSKVLFSKWYLWFPVLFVVSYFCGLLIANITLKPLKDISKSLKRILNHDLKERLKTNERNDEIEELKLSLNRMIEHLDNSLSQIKQFSSDVSHEMKTPLTILQGELEIALTNPQTQEDYEYVLISALEEVQRLSNLVGSLLELSRADTGQLVIDLSRKNLSDILIDISEDAEIMADEKGITISSDIERGVELDIDPDRIRRAINNIIDNAIKYTEAGGKIHISLSKESSWTRLIISDSGIGMEESEIPYIFDRMYRVDKSRAAHSRGAGLGLSIVKWIVDAHEGTIFVNSTPNKGTEFIIDLPIRSKDDNKLNILGLLFY